MVPQGQGVVEASAEGRIIPSREQADDEAQVVWLCRDMRDGRARAAAPDAPPGMLQNLVTMETFSVRGGQIHHVEAAPFVTIPYGLGNGWTPGSGR